MKTLLLPTGIRLSFFGYSEYHMSTHLYFSPSLNTTLAILFLVFNVVKIDVYTNGKKDIEDIEKLHNIHKAFLVIVIISCLLELLYLNAQNENNESIYQLIGEFVAKVITWGIIESLCDYIYKRQVKIKVGQEAADKIFTFYDTIKRTINSLRRLIFENMKSAEVEENITEGKTRNVKVFDRRTKERNNVNRNNKRNRKNGV